MRSARSKEWFAEHDATNRERKMPLLSLHINDSDVYSAVWISEDHFKAAQALWPPTASPAPKQKNV